MSSPTSIFSILGEIKIRERYQTCINGTIFRFWKGDLESAGCIFTRLEHFSIIRILRYYLQCDSAIPALQYFQMWQDSTLKVNKYTKWRIFDKGGLLHWFDWPFKTGLKNALHWWWCQIPHTVHTPFCILFKTCLTLSMQISNCVNIQH